MSATRTQKPHSHTLKISDLNMTTHHHQAALHTYFHVNNIDKCEVQGAFKGAPHLNRMANPATTTPESRGAIRFDAEVDSCYEGVSGKVVLVDEVKPEETVTINNLKVHLCVRTKETFACRLLCVRGLEGWLVRDVCL